MNYLSVMPIGKYKGQLLEDVPNEYLKNFWQENDIWFNDVKHYRGNIYNKNRINYKRFELMRYIKENFEKSEL